MRGQSEDHVRTPAVAHSSFTGSKTGMRRTDLIPFLLGSEDRRTPGTVASGQSNGTETGQGGDSGKQASVTGLANNVCFLTSKTNFGRDNAKCDRLQSIHGRERKRMGAFHTKLVKRGDVAEGTMAFYFEKPPGFQFKPGQYVDVILINPPEKDDEGIARSFSIASAPFEEDLMFATRMRDTAFKRVLKSMPLGTEVEIEGPYGSFVLHNNAVRPAVLLAGGIGITPFRSMVVQAAETRLPHRMVLMYCNRRPEDAAFLEELLKLQSLNEKFPCIGLMTAPERSHRHWEGEKGRLSVDMLMRHSKHLADPIYYVVGPPGMVDGVHTLLNEAGVNDDNIRSEEFGGY